MRYPENCSTVVDVTKSPYFADNTGTKDCTEVLCRVLDDLLRREAEGVKESAAAMEAAPTDGGGFAFIGFENRKYIYRGNSEINVIFPEYTPFVRVIYFPAGTYLVSDTVTYRIRDVKNIFHSKPFYQLARGIHFLGESAEKTVIRLKDHAEGFGEGSEKAVIAYIHKTPEDGRREITNVAQMNTFADLTVDCGEGNPGAVALRYVSSNSGRIENCHFRSAGSFAAVETVNGSEGVAENLSIEGFDYGIVSTDSSPLIWNHIRMKNIRKTGVLTSGRTVLTDVLCEGSDLLSFVPGFGVCFTDRCEVNEDVPTLDNTLIIRLEDRVEIRGRKTEIPFSERRIPTLRMPEFPATPAIDPAEWVSVNAFGAKGDGRTDDTEAIGRAMKSGKPYILFESGRYVVNGSISVPATVRVIDFLFCDFEAGKALREMRGEGLFSVDEDAEAPLFFTHLYTFEQLCGHFRFIRHNCRRELVLRDLHTQVAAMYFNTVRGGRVWLDNCAATTGTYCEDAILERRGYQPEYCSVIPFEFHGQWVRGRSVNPERADLEVLNDSSELLFYGFKTEGPGTMIRTVNGGKSELFVLNAGIGHTGSRRALIETDGSPVDLFFLRTGGFAPDLLFENIVSEETPTGKRTLHRTEIKGPEQNDIAHTLIEYHSILPAETKEVTVGGETIRNYRIVYAEDAAEKAKKTIPMGGWIYDSDCDRRCAERLRVLLRQLTGAELSVVSDREAPRDCEICVGKTNRTETAVAAGYRVWIEGQRLFLSGSAAGLTLRAVKAFAKALAESGNAVRVNRDFVLSSEEKLPRIACVGDSITVGWNEAYYNFDYLSYSKQLGYLLWKNATVENFSRGGVTMTYTDRYAFEKTEECAALIAAAPHLDLVTVMLGTNDGRYINAGDWNAEREEAFLESAYRLAKHLREANPDLRILFLSSPENYERADSALHGVVSTQKKIAESLRSRGIAVDFCDMNAKIQHYEDQMVPDGIHLTVPGLGMFAERLAPEIVSRYPEWF